MEPTITIVELLLSYLGLGLIGISSWVRYEVTTVKRPDEKGKKASLSKGLEYGGIILLMYLLMRT